MDITLDTYRQILRWPCSRKHAAAFLINEATVPPDSPPLTTLLFTGHRALANADQNQSPHTEIHELTQLAQRARTQKYAR